MPNDEGYTYYTGTPEEMTGRGQLRTLWFTIAALAVIAMVGSLLSSIVS